MRRNGRCLAGRPPRRPAAARAQRPRRRACRPRGSAPRLSGRQRRHVVPVPLTLALALRSPGLSRRLPRVALIPALQRAKALGGGPDARPTRTARLVLQWGAWRCKAVADAAVRSPSTVGLTRRCRRRRWRSPRSRARSCLLGHLGRRRAHHGQVLISGDSRRPWRHWHQGGSRGRGHGS